MNAYYLHKPDGTKTNVSTCGVCGKLARGESNFDISERCCTCYACGLPLAEDERRFANQVLYHKACDDKQRSEREAARLEKATEIPGYDGPVYFEGAGRGTYGDGYFENPEELAERCEDRDITVPEFAHCCEGAPIALDLENFLESACEEAYEDARDDLDGVAELQAAVDAFNALNAARVSWNPDYAHKVRVPQRAEAS